MRTTVWISLIFGGLAGFIAACLFAPTAVTVATAALVIGSWIGWGFFSAWYYGIRRHVDRHFSGDWHKGEVVRHTIKTGDRVNLQIALDRLLEAGGRNAHVFARTQVVAADDEGEIYSPSQFRGIIAGITSNPEPTPITWDRLPRSAGESLNCANNALYLLDLRGQPFCAVIKGHAKGTGKKATLQVLALTRDLAQAALDEVLRLMHDRSVYRGAIISLERFTRRDEDFTIQFHDLPAVEREAIVLPEQVLEAVERNVLGFLAYAETLRQAGRSTRHGVLLHGPPGTGKTLVSRYLARSARGYTVVLLTGRQYAYLRPACRLARLLAPSLIVLEDVDLIAVERGKNRNTPRLHDLMDEMDGIGPAADCLFLLTTNRPDTVEPALAGRPGRVDQAIYFPLPNLECRRRLFAQFGKGLNLTGVALEPLLQRTEGASPAFLQELCRRAVLMAAERGEHAQPLRLLTEDFDKALRELIEFGGELTRNFLGFPVQTPGAR